MTHFATRFTNTLYTVHHTLRENTMIVSATAAHWESLTDARRPKRVRNRRDIRNGRRRETGR